jgi:hypothetical protein
MQRRSRPRGDGGRHALLPARGWILGPTGDAVFILLTPLPILAVYLAAMRFGWLAGFVLAGTTLSMAHYLPGMLRAYGDPQLLRRFPFRFTLVPVALIVLCAMTAWNNLQGLVFLGLCWGSWHWMMQIYGFGRIYDARAGSVDRATARLDYAMCLIWFVYVGAVLNSSAANHLAQMYASGVPLVPEGAFGVFRTFWTGLTAGVSALYVVHAVRRYRSGQLGSPLKFVMIGVSLVWFGYSYSNLVEHPMASFVLFESFHDIQYLAIVWAFNLRRVEGDPPPGRLTRFLFRPRAGLVVLYVMLCLAFGSYEQVALPLVENERTGRVVFSFVTAMAFYHYYLDGFIWKIREVSTSQSLGIQVGSSKRPRGAIHAGAWSGPVRHAALWLLFALLLGGIVVTERRSTERPQNEDVYRNLAAAFPRDARFPLGVCRYENQRGRFAEADQWCQRALAIRPDWPAAGELARENLRARRHRDGLQDSDAARPRSARRSP